MKNLNKFEKFLKENKVYDEYFEKLTSAKYGGYVSTQGKYVSVSQFFEHEPAKDWILAAFLFEKLDSEKWMRLNIIWRQTLKRSENESGNTIGVSFDTEMYLKIKHTAKLMGILPEKLIALAVEKYIKEIESSIKKIKS